jgi:hypothetical protein
MEANEKNPQLEALLTSITGVSRVGAVSEGSCVACSEMATEFRDEISVGEYRISGLCQRCQDEVFSE